MISNHALGHNAEQKVAKFLVAKGYKIIELNWKIPAAEIDIVAKRGSCIYFVEVKSRSNYEYGDGFDYITRSKIKQMSRAASMWVKQKNYTGEYVLSAASIIDDDIEFIESML